MIMNHLLAYTDVLNELLTALKALYRARSKAAEEVGAECEQPQRLHKLERETSKEIARLVREACGEAITFDELLGEILPDNKGTFVAYRSVGEMSKVRSRRAVGGRA